MSENRPSYGYSVEPTPDFGGQPSQQAGRQPGGQPQDPQRKTPPSREASQWPGTAQGSGTSNRPDTFEWPETAPRPGAEQQSQGPAVCPRHPDRPAYITCQRCGRPACPDCQRTAAVGVHCVDCVAAARQQQEAAAPRSVMGGRMNRGAPVVTYAIMAVCIGVFLLEQVGLLPSALTQWFVFAPVVAFTEPWTFITSGFLHGGLLHVGLNMYALWIVGQYLEQVLGRWRYLAIFLLSVIGGHAAVLFLTPALSDEWFWGTVGASGGVFGLFGAMFVVQRRFGNQSMQVIVLIAINFAISFMYPQISWEGHLGGLVAGSAATALMFVARPKLSADSDRAAAARKAALWHALILAGLFVLIVGAAYVRWAAVFASGGAFDPLV